MTICPDGGVYSMNVSSSFALDGVIKLVQIQHHKILIHFYNAAIGNMLHIGTAESMTAWCQNSSLCCNLPRPNS